MSDFKAKMHQNRFPLGLRPSQTIGSYCSLLSRYARLIFRLGSAPGPAGGVYSAGFQGPTSMDRKERGRRGRGRDDRAKGGEGRSPSRIGKVKSGNPNCD